MPCSVAPVRLTVPLWRRTPSCSRSYAFPAPVPCVHLIGTQGVALSLALPSPWVISSGSEGHRQCEGLQNTGASNGGRLWRRYLFSGRGTEYQRRKAIAKPHARRQPSRSAVLAPPARPAFTARRLFPVKGSRAASCLLRAARRHLRLLRCRASESRGVAPTGHFPALSPMAHADDPSDSGRSEGLDEARPFRPLRIIQLSVSMLTKSRLPV